MTRSAAILSALAVLAATSAAARAATLSELADEAVRELCPEVMETETPLANVAAVKTRGYVAQDGREHPRFGRLDVVGRIADNGSIWIASARDTPLCQVGLEGEGARTAFDSLLAGSMRINPALQPDNAVKSPSPDLRLVSFRTPAADGIYFGIQFVDPTAMQANGPLMVQQYLLEE
jgi:hypothetical protein